MVGSVNPPRSMFNLSYEKKLTCDMGELIPVLCDECVPGDIWKIANQIVMRFTPLVAPIMHVIDVYVHYFFVPYRLIAEVENVVTGAYENKWEGFITGGVDGDNTDTLGFVSGNFAKGGLGDYFGMPLGITWTAAQSPSGFPWDAYHLIYDEYYRDENLQDKTWHNPAVPIDEVLLRNWEKDYFTSALLEQTRGTAPALPISGMSKAEFDFNDLVTGLTGHAQNIVGEDTATNNHIGTLLATAPYVKARNNLEGFLDNNTVDLSMAVGFDISDIRLAFQIQRFMERNERAGIRLKEFLQAHFGVSPRDERLQRPEYIGGSKCPVIISEVIQTSEDGTTPQGTLKGHGISIDQQFITKYRVEEHGLIMGLMSIMPKPNYTPQGINRQWLRKSRYDFYFPEFANLSEQAITRQEIYATAVEAENDTIFGYCGAYDEMRTKNNMVCGNFRDTYDYWHMARQFGSAPELNVSFIQCVPRKDCFAVTDEDCCLVQFGNILQVLRPMPVIAEPGFVDHV
nr:MAG: major capsid protein [Microvirus sp.]